MLSFYRGFKVFSMDAREIYSKTRYFGDFEKTPKKITQNVVVFSNGKRFPKNVYYKTGAKSVRFCYPGINANQTLYFSGKRPELQRKGKV
jgi:hypothetical protein